MAVTAKLIAELKPWYIVSFGVAGGFIRSGDDVKLLDVVVPDVVFYYEPAKETVKKGRKKSGHTTFVPTTEARPLPFTPTGQLWSVCKNVSHEAHATLGMQVRFGPLASGEKLIADIDAPTHRFIRALHEKTLAVEMEAAGVAAGKSASPETNAPHFLAVKGVSDDASRKKTGTSAKALAVAHSRKQKAAANAAGFLKLLLLEADPNPLEDMKGVNMPVLRKRAGDLLQCIPSFFKRPAEEKVIRVLSPLSSPPQVFYHFDISAGFMHWVDFCHILLLHRLQKIGFPPHILIKRLRFAGRWRSLRKRGNCNQMHTRGRSSDKSI